MRRKRPGQEQKRAFPKRLVFYGVLVVVVAVVFFLVVVPNHVTPRTVSNESAAIAALRAYVGAQNVFRKNAYYGPEAGKLFANPKDGLGFPDLYKIGGPDRRTAFLQLVDRRLAEATSPERAKWGYWFVDIVGDQRGSYDFTKDCGLCAVPAEYGKTGRKTLIISLSGTVYEKDTGGKPLTVWPDIENEGWVPATN